MATIIDRPTGPLSVLLSDLPRGMARRLYKRLLCGMTLKPPAGHIIVL